MPEFVLTQNDWFFRSYDETVEADLDFPGEIVFDEQAAKRIKDRWRGNGTTGIGGDAFDDEAPTQRIKPALKEEILIRRPKPTALRSRFLLLQQWEGCVMEVGEDSFLSIVYDQTNPKNSPEEVRLLIDDVPRGDLPLLAPGAVFYWSIGYNDMSNGQRLRSSVISFRRLPAWGRKDISRIKKKSAQLLSFLTDSNQTHQNVASE